MSRELLRIFGPPRSLDDVWKTRHLSSWERWSHGGEIKRLQDEVAVGHEANDPWVEKGKEDHELIKDLIEEQEVSKEVVQNLRAKFETEKAEKADLESRFEDHIKSSQETLDNEIKRSRAALDRQIKRSDEVFEEGIMKVR